MRELRNCLFRLVLMKLKLKQKVITFIIEKNSQFSSCAQHFWSQALISAQKASHSRRNSGETKGKQTLLLYRSKPKKRLSKQRYKKRSTNGLNDHFWVELIR